MKKGVENEKIINRMIKIYESYDLDIFKRQTNLYKNMNIRTISMMFQNFDLPDFILKKTLY